MALDFMNLLFGGSNSTSSSTPTDMTPDAYKALQPQVGGTLSNLLGTTAANTPTSYTGPLTAPVGANENTLLNQLMSMSGPSTDANQLLSKTLQGNFLPGQAGANPFLDAAIKEAQRPTFQGLYDTLTKALPGRFTAAGQFTGPRGSSAFDNAAATTARAASDTAGGIATNMSYQGYNDERNRQQGAIPLSQQEVTTTIQNLQAQALPRLIAENGIDRGIDLFKQQTTQLLQILGLTAGVAAPVIANTSTSDSTQNKGIIPAITGLLTPVKGVAGSVAGSG